MVFAHVWLLKPEEMLSSEEELKAEKAYQLAFLSKAERSRDSLAALFRSQSDSFTRLASSRLIALMDTNQLF